MVSSGRCVPETRSSCTEAAQSSSALLSTVSHGNVAQGCRRSCNDAEQGCRQEERWWWWIEEEATTSEFSAFVYRAETWGLAPSSLLHPPCQAIITLDFHSIVSALQHPRVMELVCQYAHRDRQVT